MVAIKQIDKARYRKHLNRVIAACIGALVAGSLLIARVLIILFPSESGSHFHWNLTGVVVTCVLIASVLKKVQQHPYMREVVYVWHLKQSLNKITRKMRKVKAQVEQGDVQAMHALQYSYSGSRLLWQLDDNTITMDELAVAQAQLDAQAKKFSLQPDADKHDESYLASL